MTLDYMLDYMLDYYMPWLHVVAVFLRATFRATFHATFRALRFMLYFEALPTASASIQPPNGGQVVAHYRLETHLSALANCHCGGTIYTVVVITIIKRCEAFRREREAFRNLKKLVVRGQSVQRAVAMRKKQRQNNSVLIKCVNV